MDWKFWRKKQARVAEPVLAVTDVPLYAEWCGAVADGSTNTTWPEFKTMRATFTPFLFSAAAATATTSLSLIYTPIVWPQQEHRE